MSHAKRGSTPTFAKREPGESEIAALPETAARLERAQHEDNVAQFMELLSSWPPPSVGRWLRTVRTQPQGRLKALRGLCVDEEEGDGEPVLGPDQFVGHSAPWQLVALDVGHAHLGSPCAV
jgi:hypothetical protein